MIDYILTIAFLLFIFGISATSGILSHHLFSKRQGKWIYFFSGITPLISVLLVYFEVAGAGTYNLFIDTIICIAWIFITNLLFYLLCKQHHESAYRAWLALVLFSPIVIRLSVANVFS